jgi:RNA polymerase subunit RPABC4/transcription elongation factor Spt4
VEIKLINKSSSFRINQIGMIRKRLEYIKNWSEVGMKVKMKRCINCKTLLSNSSKVCINCGSKELEKGFYTDESKNYIITNKQLNIQLHPPTSGILRCPICSAWVTIKNGFGECCFCGNEIPIGDGSEYRRDYINDRVIKHKYE